MKTRPLASAVSLSILAAVILCCRSEEAVAPQEQPYIPLITNSWTDVARADHTFNFVAQQESVSVGTFRGQESYSDSSVTFDLTGMFSNRNISFTVSRRGRDTAYSGRFVLDTLIDFNGLKLFRR